MHGHHRRGNQALVLNLHVLLGFKAKGRDIVKGAEGYRLREASASYLAHFGVKKSDIDH